MIRLAMFSGMCLFLSAASCDSTHKKDSADSAKCNQTQGGNSENSTSPKNKTPCETSAEKQKACAETPLEKCLSDEKCRILSAYRFDTSRVCRFPAEQVACAPAVFECDEAEMYVTDPSGTKWVFSNGCVPEGEGWEVSYELSVAEQEAAFGPLCP
jgi:hypothetical protein